MSRVLTLYIYLSLTALYNYLSSGSLVFTAIAVLKCNDSYLQLYFFITTVPSITIQYTILTLYNITYLIKDPYVCFYDSSSILSSLIIRSSFSILSS